MKVLKLIGLDKVIEDREDGIDSQIGSEGIKLSSGQKQLISIARAILINNKIVVLDEATSNIDLKTEKLIQSIIKSEFINSTLIVIAHRIITVAHSDRIIVMDDGKCVEFDKPRSLYLNRKSSFFRMASFSGLQDNHFEVSN